jgi:hypothetical protein
MPMLVNVQYFGKRLPLKLNMPWLSVRPITFANGRVAQMIAEDAVRLCAEGPRDFKIIGPVAEDEGPAKAASPPASRPKTPKTPKRRKRPGNKE